MHASPGTGPAAPVFVGAQGMRPERTPSAPARPVRAWFFVGARRCLAQGRPVGSPLHITVDFVGAHGCAPVGRTRRTVGQHGAALLTVLVMVVLLGLTASMASQSLGALMQREREAELLWRGQQYRQAIASYYNVKHGAQQMYPAKLDDLVKDPRFPDAVRHLRQLYPDPMTGKEWDLVKDPAEKIIGVRSTSDLEPFQQASFPKGLENLEGKTAYREWEFVFVPEKKPGTQPQPGTQAQGSRSKVQGNPNTRAPRP